MNPEDFTTLVLAEPGELEEALSIQEKFEQFHQLNPWVYRAFVKLAREDKKLGYRTSIKSLFEIVRYKYRRHTRDSNADFRINNNYHSRYARRIMECTPDLAGVFATRELKA